jgi:hypothetical protein
MNALTSIGSEEPGSRKGSPKPSGMTTITADPTEPWATKTPAEIARRWDSLRSPGTTSANPSETILNP